MQAEELQTKRGWTQGRADFMIALVAVAWGSSYVMMKVGLDGIPAEACKLCRFCLHFPA